MGLIDDIIGGDPLDELSEIVDTYYNYDNDYPDSHPIIKILDDNRVAGIWNDMLHSDIQDEIDKVIEHMKSGNKQIFKCYCDSNDTTHYFKGTPGDLLVEIHKAQSQS
jgi:hypothetical protein